MVDDDKMVPVTTNFTEAQADGVDELARRLDKPKARLYREAVDLLLAKYAPSVAAKRARVEG